MSRARILSNRTIIFLLLVGGIAGICGCNKDSKTASAFPRLDSANLDMCGGFRLIVSIAQDQRWEITWIDDTNEEAKRSIKEGFEPGQIFLVNPNFPENFPRKVIHAHSKDESIISGMFYKLIIHMKQAQDPRSEYMQNMATLLQNRHSKPSSELLYWIHSQS